MKARINTHAFRQTFLDSDALGVLGSIAHPLPDPGEYRGTVILHGAVVASFRLIVDPEASETQADVDLATLATARRRLSSATDEPVYQVIPGGYLVLFVSEGAGGFAVRLERLGDDKKPKRVFDSHQLGEGDIFIASLLRPGRYQVSDRLSKHTANLRVTFAAPSDKPYRPAAPERIRVTPTGFQPTELEVGPAQGVVFTLHCPKSVLRVDCRETDDGPDGEQASRKFRWINPAHAGPRGTSKAVKAGKLVRPA